MKCINCGIEVPSNFKSAIKSNICPSCGKSIMSEDLQSIVIELSEAISKMSNDPEGLAGWLVSNFSMQKIGEALPVDFYTAGKRKRRVQEDDFEDDDDVLSPKRNASKFAKYAKYNELEMRKKKEEALSGGTMVTLTPEELENIEDDPVIEGIEDEMQSLNTSGDRLSVSDRLKMLTSKSILEKKQQMASSGYIESEGSKIRRL